MTVKSALDKLRGRPPAPFVQGARLELVTREVDRFVRGYVIEAGSGLAQLDISNPGDPVRPKVNLIAYADVVRVREATAGQPNGNWLPWRTGRREAEADAAGKHPWWKWKAP